MNAVPAVRGKRGAPRYRYAGTFYVADNGHDHFRHSAGGEPAGFGAAKSPDIINVPENRGISGERYNRALKITNNNHGENHQKQYAAQTV
ncbi:hypothetical protein DPU24_16595 [Salmonella enterica subsp. enterica serovar Oranienburg]|nr:hypothetical protein [Salmonella enterica subsp. enterica serovar Oranienburg]